jgi:hypothetical protein
MFEGINVRLCSRRANSAMCEFFGIRCFFDLNSD